MFTFAKNYITAEEIKQFTKHTLKSAFPEEYVEEKEGCCFKYSDKLLSRKQLKKLLPKPISDITHFFQKITYGKTCEIKSKVIRVGQFNNKDIVVKPIWHNGYRIISAGSQFGCLVGSNSLNAYITNGNYLNFNHFDTVEESKQWIDDGLPCEKNAWIIFAEDEDHAKLIMTAHQIASQSKYKYSELISPVLIKKDG